MLSDREIIELLRANRERMLTAAQLKEPDQVPVLLTHQANFTFPDNRSEFGVQIAYFFPDVLYRLMKRTWSRYRGQFDICPEFSVMIEPSAFGGLVRWPVDMSEIPELVPCVRTPEDVASLQVPDPYRDGLMGPTLEVFRYMKHQHPEDPIAMPFWSRGPFTLACLLTGYLTKRYDLQTLVVFRHPCGFVSSVQRLGWPTAGFLHLLLAQGDLVEDHLYPYVDFIRRYCDADSVSAAAVLHGVLNLVLWKTTNRLKLRWRLFESLCESPVEEFERLFRYFELPHTEATQEKHRQLCFVPSRPVDLYHPHAVERNSHAMAWSWRESLHQDDVTRIRAIWREFNVPLYTEDSEWCSIASEKAARHG